MANMNFGVNILPKANNTYTLGNSDYKWNIFANTLNGVSLTNIITDIQINGTSIVNNNIATIPLATSSSFGIIKVGYGLEFDSNQKVIVSAASSGKIKTGTDYNFPIVPVRQHESVFYGLAKAAGDSTQSASSNAVGTYTDGAKTAIQNMLAVVPKNNPVFTGSISLGRDANSTVGSNSVALGYANRAQGHSSIAMGAYNYANADASVALGYNNMAMGAMSFAGGYSTHAHGAFSYTFGLNTANDIPPYTNWTASTSYAVGDNVVNSEDNLMYTCIEANSDATFNYGKWVPIVKSTFIEKIGNGELNITTGALGTPSNARALDWNGNEYLNGDLYINCNDDSSGGTSITEALNKKISITSDTVAGNPCTFNSDVEDIPLKSIKLEYEFSQSGSGDPSPTNIRPITGISDFFIANAKKNMAILRGYSAENKNYNVAGTLSNSYGTTISTTSPESSLVITQSTSTTDYEKHHYRNGYMIFRTDNMVVGQCYDVSIKVTNITSNPLETTLSELRLASPDSSLSSAYEVIGDVVIWKNIQYKDTSGRQAWEFRNCGMSCTVSEFMVTPANTNDGIYEPYEGIVEQYTFSALGKNLFNKATGIQLQSNNIRVARNSGYGIPFNMKAGVTYCISTNSITNPSEIILQVPFASTYIAQSYTNSNGYLTYTPTEDIDVAINAYWTQGRPEDATDIQIEIGSEKTTFEPYTDTVGIGTLDATSGTLTITHMIYTTTWGKGESANIKENNERRKFTAPFVFKNATVAKTGTSNIAPWNWDYDKDTVHFYNHQQYSYVFLPIGTSDDTEIQIIGQLAEPRIVSVPPITIKTFKGTNTIWANTNGSIEIENYIDLETIKEYADNVAGIQDVQINGTSIVNNNVATIPIATASTLGVVSNGGMGIGINSSGHLYLNYATDRLIKAGTSQYNAITAGYQHQSVFYGLAKAAGDTTQSASSNAVGVYTDGAKTAIRSMLGVPSVTDIPTVPVQDIQVGGTSILSNGVANIPLATSDTFGVMKSGSGLYYADGVININPATAADIKSGASWTKSIVPNFLPEAVFYGLARAANDSTQGASSNAVGVYTDTAKAAIQSMLSVAPTANPIFTGSFSHNRKASTTVGTNSFTAGDNCEASAEEAHAVGRYTTASGAYSHAEGNYTTASGMAAHAEGTVTVANHANQHVFGEYNVADASAANAWSRGNYVEIVGNGTADNAKSNARALDWAGNEYLDGDLYVNCSANSTNGYKVIADINNSITIGSTTITESQLQALLATLQ